MDLFVAGILAGVFGTLVMDLLNHFFARTGIITKIDMRILGRMTAGWTRGRLQYRHPGEMKKVSGEVPCGYLTHYAIGLGLAFIYVLGWDLLLGGPASPLGALVYGIATTVASLFFVYPSMGFGFRRYPCSSNRQHRCLP